MSQHNNSASSASAINSPSSDVSTTQFLDHATSKPNWPKARLAFQSTPQFRQTILPLPFQLYLDWDVSGDDNRMRHSKGVDYGQEALNLLKVNGRDSLTDENSPKETIIQNVQYERQLPSNTAHASSPRSQDTLVPDTIFIRVHRSNVTKTFKVSKDDTIRLVIQLSIEKLSLFSGLLLEDCKADDFVMTILGEDLMLCELDQQVGLLPRIQEKLARGEKIISLQLLDRELAFVDSLKSIGFRSLPPHTVDILEFEQNHPQSTYRIRIGEVTSHIKRHQVASIDIKVFLRFRDVVINKAVKHSKITSYDGSTTIFDEWINLDVPLSMIPRETECVFVILINDSQIEVTTPVFDSLGSLRSGKCTIQVLSLFDQIKDIVYDREPNGESIMTIEFPQWEGECVVFDSDAVGVKSSDKTLVKGEELVGKDLPQLVSLLRQQTTVDCVHQVQEELLNVLQNGEDAVQKVTPRGSYDSIARAIQMLSADCDDVRIRKAAVETLHPLSDEQLMPLLSTLLDALQYELYNDSSLIRFILHRSMQNPGMIGSQAFWMAYHLSSYNEERYVLLLHELAQNLPPLFVRDMIFPSILLVLQLSEALSHKSDQRRTILDNLYIPETQLGFPLPVARSCAVSKLIKAKSSNTNEISLTFTDSNNHTAVIVLFGKTRSRSQEAFILDLIQLMNMIWRQKGVDMRLQHLLYDVCCFSKHVSMVQCVEKSYQCIHELTPHKNPKAIAQHLQKRNAEIDNFIHSSVGYLLALYVLGISDRTLDKMFLTEKGHLVHTQFRSLLSISKTNAHLEEAKETQQTFNIQLFNVLEEDLDSTSAQSFFSLITKGFMAIREEWHIFKTLLQFSISCGVIEHMTEVEASTWIQQALFLDRSSEEAKKTFEQGIRGALHEAGMMQVSFEDE